MYTENTQENKDAEEQEKSSDTEEFVPLTEIKVSKHKMHLCGGQHGSNFTQVTAEKPNKKTQEDEMETPRNRKEKFDSGATPQETLRRQKLSQLTKKKRKNPEEDQRESQSKQFERETRESGRQFLIIKLDGNESFADIFKQVKDNQDLTIIEEAVSRTRERRLEPSPLWTK